MTTPPLSGPALARRAVTVVFEIAGWAIVILVLANLALLGAAFLPVPASGPAEHGFLDQLRGILEPVHSILAAVIRATGKPDHWHKVPLAPALFIILLLLLRALIFYVEEILDRRDEKRRAPREDGELREAERQAAARRVAVRTYADAQTVLQASRIELTFLSLDIIGSTKMKLGEDSVLVEQAFSDYMKLVNGILQRNAAWKTTWTPDGQMAAFKSPEDGVKAGQEVLAALDAFNRDVSRIKTPFRLRAGAHLGVVSTDEKTPMEKISDFSIDVAGHMQKHAAHDHLWITEKLLERLPVRDGFIDSGEVVDGFRAYGWKPGTAG